MAIFDIEKDELLRFSDTQLEELIARLAEAEVAMYGHSPACVNWSGSITAPDGGIDIQVQVPVDQLKAGFLLRPDTVFKAKKHRMPKASIEKESHSIHGDECSMGKPFYICFAYWNEKFRTLRDTVARSRSRRQYSPCNNSQR